MITKNGQLKLKIQEVPSTWRRICCNARYDSISCGVLRSTLKKLEWLLATSWCPSFRIQFSVGPNVFSYFLSLFSSSRSCRCLLSSQWLINVSPLLFYLLDEQNIFLITFTCHISKAKTQTDRLFVFIIYQIWMHFFKTHTNKQEIRN